MAERVKICTGLRIRNVDEINQSDVINVAVIPDVIREENTSDSTSDAILLGVLVKVEAETLGSDPAASNVAAEEPPVSNGEAEETPVTAAEAEAPQASSSPEVKVKAEVKEESPIDESIEIPDSPVGRSCCKYGIKCYRNNAIHRSEEAHPGDDDYKMPDHPEPPPGTPKCPYGTSCYRRNPAHFQGFSHSNVPLVPAAAGIIQPVAIVSPRAQPVVPPVQRPQQIVPPTPVVVPRRRPLLVPRAKKRRRLSNNSSDEFDDYGVNDDDSMEESEEEPDWGEDTDEDNYDPDQDDV